MEPFDPEFGLKIKAIAERAGGFQMEHFRRLRPQSAKEKDSHEWVSEIDIKTEEMIKGSLLELWDQAGFYGEESGISALKGSNYLWVVDPLDGTTNYLSGIDQFAISIALMHESTPILGSIYKPFTSEHFYGLKGKGAHYNDTALAKLAPMAIGDAVIATGFPYRSRDIAEGFFRCMNRVLELTRGIRRFGSAALDLTWVAAGWFQGFWETDLKPYDVAAAIAILNETGGKIVNFEGATYNPLEDRFLIAGRAEIVDILHKIVRESYSSSR